jgi:hypothetical protein
MRLLPSDGDDDDDDDDDDDGDDGDESEGAMAAEHNLVCHLRLDRRRQWLNYRLAFGNGSR